MYLWRASTVWWSTDENYVWKYTGWDHWCIVCVIADKKENGTVWWHVYNKSVMALVSLIHYVWIDQRYSVMALIQKVWWHLFAFEKEVQCDGTST